MNELAQAQHPAPLASASTAQGHAVDVARLAQRVYQLMCDEVRLARARGDPHADGSGGRR
jgi:hypothetical protein